MEIKAYATYDLKMYRALTRLSMCRRSNPRVILSAYTVLIAVGVVACVALMALQKSMDSLPYLLLLLFLLAVFYFMYFGFANINFKSSGKLANAKHEYIFRDTDMSVISNSGEYRGAVTLKYTMLFKVMETSEYIFLYQTKRSAYAVDKARIEGGTAEDIRAAISNAIGAKYVVCKY